MSSYSTRSAVLSFIQNNYTNREFTTRQIAQAMRRNSQDVSNAISNLRLKDKILRISGTVRDGGVVLRKYSLVTPNPGTITGSDASNSFRKAVDSAHGFNDPAEGAEAFRDKFKRLVNNNVPTKSLQDYSDEELLAEVNRRLSA